MQERQRLEDMIGAIRGFDQTLEDSVELIAMGEEEDDQETIADAEKAIRDIQEAIDKRSVEALLSGEADSNDTFMEIHSGAGGTESQDWASMLLRMYTRWAERRGFKVEVMEVQAGEEAGIKSATIQVKGHNAYGWMKTESGVHRLVRISPYDSNARRHTSFASAWVYPVIDDSIDIEIAESDCRMTLIAHPARAASTSTRRTRRCVSRTIRPVSSCSVRPNAHSTRTGRGHGTCCGPASMRKS